MTFCFIAAEILTVLFYDESVNYDKYTKDLLKNSKESYFSFTNGMYVSEEDGLKHYISNNKLSDQYFIFNSSGIKKEDDKSKYRIVILGDSFTSGGGLPGFYTNENVYTKQLSRMLNKAEDEFEVLVFSEGGINTFQELFLLKNMALDYYPDMIILQYCDNDISDIRSELGHTDSNLYIDSKTNLLFVNDHIVPELDFLSRGLNEFFFKYSSFLRFVSFKLNIVLHNDAVFNNNTKSSFESLNNIKKIADERSVPFLVINFPFAYNETNYCKEDAYGYGGLALYEKLENHLISIDVPFYNICNYVDDARSLQSKLVGENDCHYGTEGNFLAANILYEAVTKISGIGSTTIDFKIKDIVLDGE